MPKSLSKSAYQSLITDISKVFLKSKEEANRAVQQVLVKAYWQIGKRIVEVEQKNELRAEYGAQLLENISRDLTKIHGNGFSVTNLRYVRQFYLAYPIHQTFDELSWCHYQLLSRVKDKSKRSKLRKMVIKKSMSVKDLKEEIQNQNIETENISSSQSSKPQSKMQVKLHVNRGRLNLFKCEVPEGLQIEKGGRELGLGFNVYKDAKSFDILRFKHGMIVESVKGSAKKFRSVDVKRTELYTYVADVERVVDGDTLIALVSLGFNVYRSQRLRLRGINTPELKSKKGKRAKAFVQNILKKQNLIIVKTHVQDKYARYIADVFYLEGEKDPQVIASKGIYLNQQLLNEGLAVLYLGGE